MITWLQNNTEYVTMIQAEYTWLHVSEEKVERHKTSQDKRYRAYLYQEKEVYYTAKVAEHGRTKYWKART